MSPPARRESVEHAMFAENVATFKREIMEFLLTGRPPWVCSHCGRVREMPDDGWWGANDLREAVRIQGPSAMFAINELVRCGTLELGADLRVRLVR